MKRTFIEVPLFTKRWSEIGLPDTELFHLQIALLKDPESGPVMKGTGGIRKVRFPLELLRKIVKALRDAEKDRNRNGYA